MGFATIFLPLLLLRYHQKLPAILRKVLRTSDHPGLQCDDPSVLSLAIHLAASLRDQWSNLGEEHFGRNQLTDAVHLHHLLVAHQGDVDRVEHQGCKWVGILHKGSPVDSDFLILRGTGIPDYVCCCLLASDVRADRSSPGYQQQCHSYLRCWAGNLALRNQLHRNIEGG